MGNSETSVKDEEELSVQIYEIVNKSYPENSEKITGMLLESEHEELKMLVNNNREELHKRIKLAADLIREDNMIDDTRLSMSDDIDVIGNKIYGIVHQMYPVFAGNVTGMLLEMGTARLVQLLHDKNALIECIHQAAHVYMKSKTEKKEETSTNDNKQSSFQSETALTAHPTQSTLAEQEREILGEKIYLQLLGTHPNEAAKITGMLLEMDLESLKETWDNSELFDKKLNDALEVIQDVEKGNVSEMSNNLNEGKVESISKNESKHLTRSRDKHDIAEQLYLKIEAKYPSEASKITGMFLEMDLDSLKELNENSELFDNKLTESIQVLKEFKAMSMSEDSRCVNKPFSNKCKGLGDMLDHFSMSHSR